MKSKFAILKSEILRDVEKLDRLFEKFTSSYDHFQHQKEYAFLVEAAFYVNQLYTGFERIFRNIAAVFENSIDEKAWHKSLLDRMIINIENIRPAVISEANYKCLDELRAFHLGVPWCLGVLVATIFDYLPGFSMAEAIKSLFSSLNL